MPIVSAVVLRSHSLDVLQDSGLALSLDALFVVDLLVPF